MAKISRDEHVQKSAWLRSFFQKNPSSTVKAANDAAFEVFGARIRNQTVFKIRQEVRDAMGLRVEDVQPRKGRPLLAMQERRPPGGREEDDQAKMFQDEPPPTEYTIEPLDPDTGQPLRKPKPPRAAVPAVPATGRKKRRVLVEGTPEQLEFLTSVIEDLKNQGMADLKVSSVSEEFVVIERTS